ncbi:MAG TPA: hypothetical protein VFW92_05280 [Candidatus Limnocylindrales bacterium]|jgi:hypothetical protein|nr:hypothetical protein [Candidatus Limnocylindrales bacterium]
MRIYEGSPRQDFEEVLRSIGAFLDQRGMREVLFVEDPEGFVVQGLVTTAGGGGNWSDSMGQVTKETFRFQDDDISRFMDEALTRRNSGAPLPDLAAAGPYERAFRVLGRYMDAQKPRDVFFFEQGGSYVLRLLMAAQNGTRHELAEFTPEDIERMIAEAPSLRQPAAGQASTPAGQAQGG